MLRRRRRQPESSFAGVDLAALGPRWRAAVEETVSSRERLRALIEGCRPGPLQDRLSSLGPRVDAGVVAAWTTASRAQTASEMLAAMDLEAVRAQLKEARRRLVQGQQAASDTARLEMEVTVLAEQHAALSQLSNAIEDAGTRLRMLDLRLDAAVARAAQIVLRPDAMDRLGGVEDDLVAVVEELGAVQAGLDSVAPLGP